ncbi:MAG: HAD hydrolase family protein, partial [Bacteroidota bacterium]|nr:HAD hydrolase family protein [Bacteroidota bacterium]
MNILSKFRSVRIFVFDMDGVLTDGGLFIEPDGIWTRRMDIKDGYALNAASKAGYKVIVISGSQSDAVANRLHKLGISEVYMNVTLKEEFLKKMVVEHDLSLEELLYMGDDLPDSGCLAMAGLSCCPADAPIEIKEICSYISPFQGGRGCVRDVIEKVLILNQKWQKDTSI